MGSVPKNSIRNLYLQKDDIIREIVKSMLQFVKNLMDINQTKSNLYEIFETLQLFIILRGFTSLHLPKYSFF